MCTKLIIGVVVMSLVLIACFGFQYQAAISRPIAHETLTFTIEKGDSLAKVTKKLIDLGLAINPFWFKVVAYQQNASNKLKVGEYELTANLTIPQLLTLFAEGQAKKYAITFPEGWNSKQILQEIKKNPNLQATLPPEAFDSLPGQLGMGEKNPEGWFFPDTYYFEKNATDISILKRAYAKMQAVLAEEWQNKEANLPYKQPYEALVMASIVEKETGAKSERPRIAGVFVRRLAKGMLLQTDPTVIYGMGDKYKGNIRAKDLTTPTPYNTYVIAGLPPTPIAMPGRAAIHAALHPGKDDSLYFVAKGDGSHQFSKTIADHNRAVNLFQRHKK